MLSHFSPKIVETKLSIVERLEEESSKFCSSLQASHLG